MSTLQQLREPAKLLPRSRGRYRLRWSSIQVEANAPGATPLPSPFGEEWPFNDDFFRRFFGQPMPGGSKARQDES